MSIFFDYDPVTGITQHFDYDPITDKIHLHHTQDVSAILDDIKNKRGQAKQKGQVETFAHYATIPAIVELQLAKKGLRLSDKNATKAIIREIESAFPYCKVTDKKHG